VISKSVSGFAGTVINILKTHLSTRNVHSQNPRPHSTPEANFISAVIVLLPFLDVWFGFWLGVGWSRSLAITPAAHEQF
jgi:hypothetical protein